MIKSDKGSIQIEGEMTTVRAEFACLARSLREIYAETLGEKKAKDMIRHDFESSFMSIEELEKKTDEAIKNILGSKKIDEVVEFLTEVISNG